MLSNAAASTAPISWPITCAASHTNAYTAAIVDEARRLIPAATQGRVERVVVSQNTAFPKLAAIFADTPATTLQACALGLERYDPDVIHRSSLTLADVKPAQGDVTFVDPARGRLATTDVADQEAHADGVGEMAIRPQGDVVAEPRGLLVRVRVAAQPGQQRDVVDDRSLGLLELEVLGDTEPEYAGAQHVLHRLAEPQVRGQRDRGESHRG